MKANLMKKLVVSGLTLSMVLGTGTAAFAKDFNQNKGDNNYQTQKKNTKSTTNVRMNFKDMTEGDVQWATQYIADLANRQIFEGYPDGTFQPQNTVTRIEAITAAVRLMGLRATAESSSKMQTNLNFKDANQVPSWAVGYVAVAVENNLFAESDTQVNPNQAADRLWATTLLVKALGLQSEADSKMNVHLPFVDAGKVPAGSVGYLQVAIEKGLVNGFQDNTFRPNQQVTRAEIAALLDRTGNQLPSNNDGLVNGTVAAPVTNNILTLTDAGQTNSLTLDSNAFIYRGGVQVSISALQVGDVVKTRSYNNNVIYVEVTQPVGTPVTTNSGVTTGTIAALVNNNILTISSNGQTVNLTLSPNTFIYRAGAQVSSSALQVGDVVNINSYNNTVISVEVTQPVNSTVSQDGLVTGTIVSPVYNNVLTITNSAGQTVTLGLNSNTSIYRGGVQVSASALLAGDVVNAYTTNNAVNLVQVTSTSQVLNLNVSGTLNGTTLDSQGKISTISINQVDSNGTVQTFIYAVSPTVTISGDASQLVQNHSILLQGSNQVVSTIVIQ
ncbi:S-layer homology domain-containing protein [Paenibacillus sp. GP183]|uniref:S-layer homology domain-containing protein n=1 Tax=Paenibacillus sp. GP183 TaxID=1882751 RepID=UPI00089C37F1|nr:S-layer homology domain-containing protein [Paenibacillus sp. GP183]SEC24556.1 S-layer homology domain-containing protein [Paenibacillus sp. GP183]